MNKAAKHFRDYPAYHQKGSMYHYCSGPKFFSAGNVTYDSKPMVQHKITGMFHKKPKSHSIDSTNRRDEVWFEIMTRHNGEFAEIWEISLVELWRSFRGRRIISNMSPEEAFFIGNVYEKEDRFSKLRKSVDAEIESAKNKGLYEYPLNSSLFEIRQLLKKLNDGIPVPKTKLLRALNRAETASYIARDRYEVIGDLQGLYA